MTLRQTMQAAPVKTTDLITKLSATSNQAVKTRENLFAELSDELARFVEIEERQLLPLLQKHPDIKGLAADAFSRNKELRATLARLADLPKDNDAFLAELGELDKAFQHHVRSERKELLPAALKALSDEEASGLAADIEGAVADAEKAKRDAKRDEVAQAKRQADEAEQAAEAQRAAVRAQKTADRITREATEKVVDTIADGAASVHDNTRKVTASIMERVQHAASETRNAMTVYSDSAQTIADDLQAIRATTAVSVEGMSEIYSAWMDWYSKAASTNANASQQLFRCNTFMQVAELQRQFVTTAMRNWMEGSTKVLQITQRASKQALRPLDGRLSEAV